MTYMYISIRGSQVIQKGDSVGLPLTCLLLSSEVSHILIQEAMKLQVLLCIWICFIAIYPIVSSICTSEPELCSECTTIAYCKTNTSSQIIPQKLLTSILELNILYKGNENAGLNPASFDRYVNLRSITISGAKITFIEEKTFSSLKSLVWLAIYKTSITELPNEVLPMSSKIVSLVLENNLLTNIPSFLFPNLPSLTRLDVGFNHIIHKNCTTIGEDFKQLSNLNTVILSNMTIPNECKTEVPDDFFLPLQRTVTHLNLTMSNIYNGSQAIFKNFTKLEVLDISIAKRFTSCPADAKELFLNLPQTLKRLVFRRWRTNRIINGSCTVTNETLKGLRESPNLATIDTMFSDFMFGDTLNNSVFVGFQNLKYLNIGYSRFARIEHDAFHQCLNLTTLHLDGNSLGSRPFKLFQNLSQSNLRYLSMRECYVYSDYSITYDAAPLLKVSPLNWIDLRHNYIVTMPSFADNETDQYHLNSLVTIHLDFNQLSDIQSGGNLTAQCDSLMALRSLFISNNRLKKVQGLCPSIKNLNLASNQLYHYWFSMNEASVTRLQHLESLDISDNQITSLSWNFTSVMTNLTELITVKNNITSIDHRSFNQNHLLKVLDVSANFLTEFKYLLVKNLSKLRTLKLDDNDITSIDEDLVKKFVNKSRTLKTFGVVGNPLSCLCDQEFFHHFINQTDKIPFANKLICHDPASLRGKKIYEYRLRIFECHIKFFFIIFVSLLGGVIVAVPLYKYRWYIAHSRVVVKTIIRHLSDVQFEQTCLYDAYIMYDSSSEEDQLWVTKDLRLAIEDYATTDNPSTTNLKLYITDRDVLPGSNVYTEMIKAMEKSRKIIIVLSNSFLRRPRCKGQADLAGRETFGCNYYQPHRIMVLIREKLDEEAIKAPFTSLLTENVVDAQATSEQKIERTWRRIRKFVAQPTFEYVRNDRSSLEISITNASAVDSEGRDNHTSGDPTETTPLIA
ncbi:toll-like receptor 3 [Watersipora subatra]|uniref:toll-like receptor 3 n=1 Tax=Watersipora subatra TaxID=2589382 RepID=UPI00355AEE33